MGRPLCAASRRLWIRPTCRRWPRRSRAWQVWSAGLIFRFARHITNLSAIIFLINPRWRILTALILSETEQGGMSVAAAYSVLLMAIAFGAIGVMYTVTGWAFKAEERVDIALRAG